ncbi:MAG: penicillin-binding protein 2, partial [Bdellovibrionales bacterium]|nr:penicillin-binding protein 2 [Bdellovibrionales bacterium]
MLGQNEQLQGYQDRFRYLYVAVAVALSLLFLRLWYLQLFKGAEFKQFAEENRLKKIKVDAPRGMVFDRNRKLLLDNQPTFTVSITPQYFQAATKEERALALAKLGKIVRIAPSAIEDLLYKARRQPKFQPVVVKKNLSMDEVALIEMDRLMLPGIEVAVGIRRTNVHGVVGAQMLGYIAEIDADELPKINAKELENPYVQGDPLGKMGLEQQWEKTLRGENGIEYIEVDAYGRKKVPVGRKRGEVVQAIPPKPFVPGKNLVLTVDEDLQLAAAEAFGEEKTGALVALDPGNGEVLAMLSWPSFDSTEFSVGVSPEYWKQLATDDRKPLRDKTIYDHYSPGSTFKMLLALTALEKGIVDTEWSVTCAGAYRFGNKVFKCEHVHGRVALVEAIHRSCNVYFYQLMLKVGLDEWSAMGRRFGFGRTTKVDITEENAGLMPDRDYYDRVHGKGKGTQGYLISLGIGQGEVGVTPLQMANYAAMLANKGRHFQPHVVNAVYDRRTKRARPVAVPEETVTLSDRAWDPVREGMRRVVMEPGGTGWASRIPGIVSAGKTGTAQNPHGKSHAWFIGFAPYDDPKIAVCVL